MTIVRVFEGLTPPRRGDDVAWTSLQIGEAAIGVDTWTTIDTQPWTSEDEHDRPRGVWWQRAHRVTTTNATLDRGRYRFQWLDDDSNRSGYTPERIEPDYGEAAADVTPSLQQVAQLIPTRAYAAGVRQSTFTSTTTITDTQAQGVIDYTVSTILPKFRHPIPTRSRDSVRGLLALRAAAQIESGHFREQIQAGTSPYQSLVAQAIDLEAAIRDDASDRRALV